MSEDTLRVRLGILLVILHFGILIILFISYFLGGFRFDELTTSAAIIIPMFAGFTTAIVTYLASNRYQRKDATQRVTVTFAAMSAAFPLALSLTLTAIIILFANGEVFRNFEEFKGTLALTETIFSGYVAKFVHALFHQDGKKHADTETQVQRRK